MKKFTKILLSLLVFTTVFSFSYAQEWKWTNRWSTPMQVFETFVDKTNDEWRYNVQDTALDWVTDLQWIYPRQYKISNTLDYIRQEIDPYLQRAAYIGLVASTAWLIICWFLLVTWWISKSSWFEKVKWKIFNALIWVFLLSGFYLVVKLFISIINMFFWGQ
mgnify:FL=1